MSTHRVQPIRLLRLLAVPLALGALATTLFARQGSTQQFAVADLFFAQRHRWRFWDSCRNRWRHVDEPGGRGPTQLLRIVTKGMLHTQGLTQLAFESAEPDFEELDPKDFFARFPEGLYDIEATAQEGGTFKSKVHLSHVMAAPPEATVNGLPTAEDCDATDLPEVVGPVLIDWEPVEESHPEIGEPGQVKSPATSSSWSRAQPN